MKNLPKYLNIIFWIVVLINLTANLMKNQMLEYISKPLLMIILMVYFTLKMKTMRGKVFIWTFFALFFSWCGDLFLMFQATSSQYFLIGLVCFLLTHVCYIFDFSNLQFSREDHHPQGAFVNIRMVFLAMVGSAIYYLFYPGLGDLKFPVAIYTFVLILMAIFAVKRKGLTNDQSFILVYSGALLFITSDALIGINKFIRPINYAGLLIMATYVSAQYMIVRGILAHVRDAIND